MYDYVISKQRFCDIFVTRLNIKLLFLMGISKVIKNFETSKKKDIPLFEGIIGDLFPGIKLTTPDFNEFLTSVKKRIAGNQLQPVPWFINKITQAGLKIKSKVITISHF